MMSWVAGDPPAKDDWVVWLDWSPEGPGISSNRGSDPIPLVAKSRLPSFTSLPCRIKIVRMIFIL